MYAKWVFENLSVRLQFGDIYIIINSICQVFNTWQIELTIKI